ncbi:polyprenyl synthetase family protein [Saccharopolyspora sp. NPDC049426]|uniref:polyprenyl synthetase family protein n=1 Tax=Saccharopolyspora sp. NPDC049426 TaxID=3155652 RepID=UPI0034283469
MTTIHGDAEDVGIAPSADDIRRSVDAALHRFLATQAGQHDKLGDPHSAALLRDFVLHGGKRLRPLFCYWGWRGAGGQDGEGIITAAASLELFHAFALIHDDLMDASPQRRGKPSLHRAWADLHAQQGWRGDGDRFGHSMAILAGDLLLTLSDEMFHSCHLPESHLARALPWLHAMRSEIFAGQSMELREQARGSSDTVAFDVIRYKSAKYTIERPLHIGAALASSDASLALHYTDYAIPLGEAFQLRDDLLGVFGDPSATGKSTMDDLREGKPTVLMAITRQQANPDQLTRIDTLHGNPEIDEVGCAELRHIIIHSGALSRVERMIDDRVTRARQALHNTPVPTDVRSALQQLTTAATHRTV